MSDRAHKTGLTHLDESGAARMVDVGEKQATKRQAIASGKVLMDQQTLDAILSSDISKGDVLATSRIAGIMAAKKTGDLIPLCHPLTLDKVSVDIRTGRGFTGIEILATASLTGKTGVEMEAMTAVSVACLTIYDMAKALQKDIVISDICLLKKTGGKSGAWTRDD